MIARISVSACALAQTLGSTDSAAVDAIKFAVGTGLFFYRGCSARLCRLAVITAIARVTCCARARFSDAADTATVDAIELAVGAGRHVLV